MTANPRLDKFVLAALTGLMANTNAWEMPDSKVAAMAVKLGCATLNKLDAEVELANQEGIRWLCSR